MKISFSQILVLVLLGILFFGDTTKILKKIKKKLQNFRKKGT